MSLNATAIGGKKFADIIPLEPGTYPARLRGVINAGLHALPAFKGQEKAPAQKLILIWELVDEFLPDEDGQPDESKPRNVSEDMPFYSLQSERATSTQRYKTLDPNGLHNGDWSALVNFPAMVTTANSPMKNGGVWTNVAGVSAMRSSQAKGLAPLVNPALVFDFYSPDMETWEKLPKWVQKKCQESLEFKGSELEDHLSASNVAVEETYKDGVRQPSKTQIEIDEEEAPF